MSTMFRPRSVALAALAALLGAGTGRSQDPPAQQNTAHVRAYPEPDLLVQRAPVLAAQGRWAEAFALYEDALAKHPHTVMPLDAARAVGLLPFVRSQIDAWPKEGLDFIRRRSDPLAEHEFQSARRARDVVALEALIERHPWYSGIDEVLLLAGTLRLDAGDAAGAAETLERLLARPAGPQHGVAAARLALACARAGRLEALESLSARAGREFPGLRVRWSDGEIPLPELVERLRTSARALPAGKGLLEIPAWPMPGGAPSGTALAEPGVALSRLAWADVVGLPRLSADGNDMVMRRTLGMSPTADFRPLFPAVADGIVYVHNGLALTAYSLFAREPERLWQYRAPPPAGEVMFDNRVIYAPVAHDGRVYANLITATGGAEDQLGYVRVKFPFPKRGLHAFDAHTGRLLWRLGGRLREDELEKGASFATGPTPDGARLYVGAVVQKFSTDPFEHHVLCVEAATGRVLWSTFVASGGTEINLFGNSTRESMGSPVSVDEDGVYYVTQHGVAAALEKKTGRLRWTYRYGQQIVNPTRSVYVTKNRLEWVSSPPVAADGVVVVTPADSPRVYALDAREGRLLWSRPRGGAVRLPYGARGRTLVLGGDRLEFVDLKTGLLLAAPVGPELNGTGRGALAEDGIYVPCRDGLRKVSWDGTWDETLMRPWPDGQSDGGNLVVVDGAILLATQDALQIHFDRRDQERMIAEALERHPGDPSLLYRAALRWIQAGRTEEASGLLTRCVEKTRGSAEPAEERLHRAALRRLYKVAIGDGREALQAGRLPVALLRFEEARRHAPDDAAGIEAALEMARTRLSGQDPRGAVSEYQRLIAEQGTRTFEGIPVFEIARAAIAKVLGSAGREAYAEHEAEASRRLAAARRGGDPERLMEVYRGHPNAPRPRTGGSRGPTRRSPS
jgi:outer membrane protein assembly factor BamB